MSAPTLPRICTWGLALIERAAAQGLAVDVRRGLGGSTRWRIDGGRWLCTHDAHRRLEVLTYGRTYP